MLLPWGVVPAMRIVLLGPNIAQPPMQTMEGLVFMSARLVLTPLATRVLAMATQLMRIAVAATVNGVALTLPWVQERWSRRWMPLLEKSVMSTTIAQTPKAIGWMETQVDHMTVENMPKNLGAVNTEMEVQTVMA
jgi:hypothetical protein